MKKLCSVLFFGFSVISVIADDIETRRAEETGKRYDEYKTIAGRVYKDVLITKIDDAGIHINHADGAARLRFEHLNPEKRKQFGITKEGASEIYAQEMRLQAAYEAKVAEQQKANRELAAKHMAALVAAERLAAERAQQNQKQIATTIQSNLEIPTFPSVNASKTGVLYGSRPYTPARSTYYYGGGYAYPASYGYYPRPYPSYYPTRSHCNSSSHRSSIFHFTIK